jgi:hypothetical protein
MEKKEPRLSKTRQTKNTQSVLLRLSIIECEKLVAAEKEKIKLYYANKLEHHGIKMRM